MASAAAQPKPAQIKTCKSCHKKTLRSHCPIVPKPNPGCDLLICMSCKSIGTRDGKRWQPYLESA